MKDLSQKVAEVMSSTGEEVTLFTNRYDDGTSEEPDVVYDRFCAVLEGEGDDRTIAIYVSKEDEDHIYAQEGGEIYRFPLIQDRKLMERIFAEIVLRECV